MTATAASARGKLSDRHAEVLAVIDEPLCVREIAEKLGSAGTSSDTRYRQINKAVEGLTKKGVLTFKVSIAGYRFYYRRADRERAIGELFSRFGGAETAAAIVDYAQSTLSPPRNGIVAALHGALATRKPRRKAPARR